MKMNLEEYVEAFLGPLKHRVNKISNIKCGAESDLFKKVLYTSVIDE